MPVRKADKPAPAPPSSVATMFHGRFRFVTSADHYRQLPNYTQPEIAVIGRSNCGKSSLLNSLMGHKNLARTSNTPGRTRLFNVFALQETLILLDLPGYGYARASAKNREHWSNQWQGYLGYRDNLRHVLLLVDARRGLMAIDRKMMALLDARGTPYTIVLTKCDKLPSRLYDALSAGIQSELLHHPAAQGEVMLSSAKSCLGIDPLRQKVLQLSGLANIDEIQPQQDYSAVIARLISEQPEASS